MIIKIRVLPRSSRAHVEESGDAYKVYCTRPAVDGMANEQALCLISEYLKVKKYQLRIIRGFASRTKFVEILNE